MTGSAFDTLARSTKPLQGRRQALQAIGAAALAAAGAPLLASAKKNRNGNGNNNGNNKNKDKKRCKKQVGVCEQEIRIVCGNDAECVARQLPCCQPLANCNIQEFFDCLQQQ